MAYWNGSQKPKPQLLFTEVIDDKLYIGITKGNTILVNIPASWIVDIASQWSLYPAIHDIDGNGWSIYGLLNTTTNYLNVSRNLTMTGNIGLPYWNTADLSANIKTARQTTINCPTNEQYFSDYQVYTNTFDFESLPDGTFQTTNLSLKTYNYAGVVPTGDLRLESFNYTLLTPSTFYGIPYPSGTSFPGYWFTGIEGGLLKGPGCFIRGNYGSVLNPTLPDSGALLEINADSVVGITPLASSRIKLTAGRIQNVASFSAFLAGGGVFAPEAIVFSSPCYVECEALLGNLGSASINLVVDTTLDGSINITAQAGLGYDADIQTWCDGNLRLDGDHVVIGNDNINGATTDVQIYKAVYIQGINLDIDGIHRLTGQDGLITITTDTEIAGLLKVDNIQSLSSDTVKILSKLDVDSNDLVNVLNIYPSGGVGSALYLQGHIDMNRYTIQGIKGLKSRNPTGDDTPVLGLLGFDANKLPLTNTNAIEFLPIGFETMNLSFQTKVYDNSDTFNELFINDTNFVYYNSTNHIQLLSIDAVQFQDSINGNLNYLTSNDNEMFLQIHDSNHNVVDTLGVASWWYRYQPQDAVNFNYKSIENVDTLRFSDISTDEMSLSFKTKTYPNSETFNELFINDTNFVFYNSTNHIQLLSIDAVQFQDSINTNLNYLTSNDNEMFLQIHDSDHNVVDTLGVASSWYKYKAETTVDINSQTLDNVSTINVQTGGTPISINGTNISGVDYLNCNRPFKVINNLIIEDSGGNNPGFKLVKDTLAEATILFNGFYIDVDVPVMFLEDIFCNTKRIINKRVFLEVVDLANSNITVAPSDSGLTYNVGNSLSGSGAFQFLLSMPDIGLLPVGWTTKVLIQTNADGIDLAVQDSFGTPIASFPTAYTGLKVKFIFVVFNSINYWNFSVDGSGNQNVLFPA